MSQGDIHTIEAEMGQVVYESIQKYTTLDERGAQSARYEVGVSDLGFCSERTRRMLAQEDPEDTDWTLAFIGTAIGDHLERAVKQYGWPSALIQPSVMLRLTSDTHTYDIPGHPDIVLPDGILLDGKTKRGLSLAEQAWKSSRQNRFQRHGYAKACHDAGMFDCPREDVLVGNIYVDRAGDDRKPLVRLEPYDPDVIFEMTEWLEEVIYDFTHSQTSRKEPPREVCAATCGFFATCRAFDTDVEGLLTDEVTLEAIGQYRQGLELEKAGARLKDQAKPALVGTEGFALVNGERFALRWVHINEAPVSFVRKASEKIDLRKVK